MDNGFADIPPIEDAQEGKSNKTLIIIIVAVLVVICCCCLVGAGGLWYLYQNGDQIFDLLSRLPSVF
ncbi:hypothetical protein ACFLZW_01035 [Chloroflexota bacterium]